MVFGWVGAILRVDLSKGKAMKKKLSPKLAHAFIGGRGINSKILYDEVKPGIDPFSPDNRLIFGTGPLTGTLTPSGRWTVTAKSPLTDIHGDAHAGGHWAPELKFTGYDHIVIQGRAEKPVYLWIHDGDAELKDANEVWGKDTWEAQRIIKKELGDPNVQIACIGQGGERLVRFANIIHCLKRAAGRCGIGAVMGSKNLKAVAVRGTGAVKVAKPREFRTAIDELNGRILNHPFYPTFSTQGTSHVTRALNEIGRLLVKNYQFTTIEEIDEISGENLLERYVIKNNACFGCPVHCSHFFEVTEGPYAGTLGDGPEYGCIGCNGPNCGIHYLPAILKINNLANQYGLDLISLGHTIGAAMEWYQRGVITKKDTDGIPLEWGDYHAAIEMIEKIARREGFGDTLAEGALKAAKRIGRQAAKYVQHCLGMELCVDVRPFKGFALSFSTSTRGADHLRGEPFHIEQGSAPKELLDAITDDEFIARKLTEGNAYEYKEISVAWCENVFAVIDSLPICWYMHTTFHMLPEHMARLFSAATGIEMSEEILVRVGERIYNVERAFNVREGISINDDTLPERMFEPIVDGPNKGEVIVKEKFEEMRDKFYKLRGWDPETGIPTRSRLEELGLKDVADDLEKRRPK